jgi:hypothetical protein
MVGAGPAATSWSTYRSPCSGGKAKSAPHSPITGDAGSGRELCGA